MELPRAAGRPDLTQSAKELTGKFIGPFVHGWTASRVRFYGRFKHLAARKRIALRAVYDCVEETMSQLLYFPNVRRDRLRDDLGIARGLAIAVIFWLSGWGSDLCVWTVAFGLIFDVIQV